MFILPAIDIKDGKCVRLYKGKFETVHQVADDYMTTALKFEKDGAKWIHTVDLDGAKEGKPVNDKIYIDIAAKTNLKVEVGGGIRNLETIEYYLNNGISRVILGSVALSNRQLVVDAVKNFGAEKIAVGIDAKHEFVRASGWLDKSDIHYLDLAEKMEQSGVKYIIYTDISKDGTLEGLNTEHLKKLSEKVKCNIIASGGVKDMDDIKICKEFNLYGVICGKSIYSGSLNLAEAVKYAE
jgi:phosphoribosylformimino-5-aminoimidazole carboxamide ribotide isomerase